MVEVWYPQEPFPHIFREAYIWIKKFEKIPYYKVTEAVIRLGSGSFTLQEKEKTFIVPYESIWQIELIGRMKKSEKRREINLS